MSLPRFFARVDDSISPLLANSTDLRAFLSSQTVCLEAHNDIEHYPVHIAGLLLAVNLSARLYPRLRFIGPPRVTAECAKLAHRINPGCEILLAPGESTATLGWGVFVDNPHTVCVSPSRWDIIIDSPEVRSLEASNALTALAAGALGASEIFRGIFGDFLPRPRRGPEPGGFNLLTLAGPDKSLPDLPQSIDIGNVCLVGAGAVGQAFAHTLASAEVRGALTVIDHERISLSNLQRYVLAFDDDVETSKVSLVERALLTSGVRTSPRHAQWDVDSFAEGDLETLCVAVDTEALRIALQAALPKRIYNAWTQPTDIGWSRHENFGVEPCLACLYWPTHPRLNYYELISRAVHEHGLRVLTYLTFNIPVDSPIPPGQIPQLPNLPAPPEAAQWMERGLLQDIAHRFGLPEGDLAAWRGKQLTDLYHEGICAGALIRHQQGRISTEVAVPLAHQSAMAGIMLATELLVSASPELVKHRPSAPEGRLNLLSGLPQLSARPRLRTPNCLCFDNFFLQRYSQKWDAPV